VGPHAARPVPASHAPAPARRPRPANRKEAARPQAPAKGGHERSAKHLKKAAASELAEKDLDRVAGGTYDLPSAKKG
jgi:hypothetical protein